MNENDIYTMLQGDDNLREAIRRHEQKQSPMPADLNERLMKRLEEPAPNLSQKEGRTRYLRWMAAAACLLVIIGVGVKLIHKEETAKPVQMIVQQTKPVPVPKWETPSFEVRNAQFQSRIPSVSKSETAQKQVPMKRQETKTTQEPEQETFAEHAVDDLNVHYAAHIPEEETVPYQDPARVDEFIEKMAAYHNVKEGELTCSSTNDSNVVSRVYVFPDKKEVDVFGRLLQVACWYSDETPGYHLNFSHQQFFFELKDKRKQLQYRWIAERMNGKILLYGTNAPIGANTSSACYMEYRDKLMHTQSINTKTREI
jgi:hypothetical protein